MVKRSRTSPLTTQTRATMRPVRLTLAVLWAFGISAACAAPQAPPPDRYDVGVRPRSIAAADLDRDGHLDLVVCNAGDGTATILRGGEGGRLRPLGPAIRCGKDPSDVDAIDLDRDGDADLVIANHETSLITVLLNDGKAKFTPARGSPIDTGVRPHVHSVATGDFDGDGWIDVAVESADTKEVRLLPGGPRGFGSPTSISIGTMPYSRLGAADLSGDGLPDVLVPGHGDRTVRFVRRTDRGLALSSEKIDLPGQPWLVIGDDVTGDGRKDIIVVLTDGVGVWIATPKGFAASPGTPFAVAGATDAATGDMDGDGIADIAIGPWNGSDVTIIQGRTMAVRKIRACTRPMGLAIADLDGDRRGELLAACTTENRLMVLKWPAE